MNTNTVLAVATAVVSLAAFTVAGINTARRANRGDIYKALAIGVVFGVFAAIRFMR